MRVVECRGVWTYKSQVHRLRHVREQPAARGGRAVAQGVRRAAVRVIGVVEGLVGEQLGRVGVARHDEGGGGGDGGADAVGRAVEVLVHHFDVHGCAERHVRLQLGGDLARADQFARGVGADVGGLRIPRVLAGGDEGGGGVEGACPGEESAREHNERSKE